MASKLVVDTCVFVDGYFNATETSSSNYFVSNLDDNERLVFSQDTIGELMYTFKKICNKHSFDADATSETLALVAGLFQSGKSINTNIYRKRIDKILARDEDDQMFIDAAFSAKASHLITSDKKSGILELRGTPFTCCNPDTYLTEKLNTSNTLSI